MASRLVNCEKTSALWPSSSTSRSCSSSMSSLALLSCSAFGVDQAGMAGGLAQPQQRLQNLNLGLRQAFALNPLQQRVAVVLAQFVVELALGGLQLAIDGLLGFGGSSGATCSLVRRRMNGRSAWASSWRVSSSGLRAAPPVSLNTLARAQHARIEELEQATTIRPGGSPPACRSAPGDACRAAAAPPWPIRWPRS